jgi:methylthioribose-1-phosphate isomerase
LRLNSLDDVAQAIRSMQVRGAPLIGVSAAYGLALALARRADDATLLAALQTLAATRPTAVNLHWALARMQACLLPLPPRRVPPPRGSRRAGLPTRTSTSVAGSASTACSCCSRVGGQGRLEIMTHCNAGWLATVDHGTALAPVYAAFDAGIDIHVWVSETRPRNQGLLTAWELRQHGVPHTVIADNAAGLLLARGTIDAVIVGADRIAANGDVANKIGTWLKALAARAAGVPFSSPRRARRSTSPARTAAIPIEERAATSCGLSMGCDAPGTQASCGSCRPTKPSPTRLSTSRRRASSAR